MGVTITDDWPAFEAKRLVAMDTALEAMAIDIERLSKTKVPAKQGYLRSTGQHSKEGPGHWIVSYRTPYAMFQEYGVRADGTHRVKNYTTSGTGPFYLENSGKQIVRQGAEYFLATKKSLGL